MDQGTTAPRLVVLSAAGVEQLDRYRLALSAWLRAHLDDPAATIDRVAHTLWVGREPLTTRLAVVAAHTADLAERLDSGEGVLRGHAAPAGSGSDTAPAIPRDAHDAARLWVAGTPVAWPPAGSPVPARLSLPSPPPATRAYWIDPPASLDPPAAPGERVLTGEEFFLRDHALGAVKVLPAVAALEFAAAAAAAAGHGRVTGIANVLWARPVLVTGEPVAVRVVLSPRRDGVAYELRRVDGSAAGEICSAGTMRFTEPGPAPTVDLDAVRVRLPHTATADEVYGVFTTLGGGYGPSLRGITGVHHRPGEALATVAVPAAAGRGAEGFTLHPSLLDAMLQAALWTSGDPRAARERELPFSLDAADVFAPLPDRGYIHAVATAEGHDLSLVDDDGRVALRLRGVRTRSVAGAAVLDGSVPATHLLAQVWHPSPPTRGEPPARVVLVGDDPVLAAALGAKETADRAVTDGTDPVVVVRTAQADPLPGVLALFRAWAARPARGPVRLVQLLHPTGGVDDVRTLALEGLARTLAAEHPDFRLTVLSAPDTDSCSTARLVADEATSDWAPLARHTGAGREVPRWEPVTPTAAPITPRAGHTYLVTGGAGALGRLLVARLGGPARYVLTGRAATADLSGFDGVEAHYAQCDLGVPGAAQALVSTVRERFGPVHGVFHLAGTTRDSFLLRKTDDELAAVLGPKVRGTLELDAATAGEPLEFFIAYSSMSGAAGSPGQGDYAYANRFLDAFARWRRAAGRPGRSLSLLWSLWADGGIKVDADEATQQRLARRIGLWPLPTDAAFDALDRALGHDGTAVLIAHGELDKLRAVLDPARPAEPPTPAAEPPPVAVVDNAAAEDFLRAVLAGVFALPADELDADTAFEQYGIDSILIMDLTRRLEEHFGSLPKTLFFEYQDLRSLTGWFTDNHAARMAELVGPVEPEPAAEPVAARPERTAPARPAPVAAPATTAPRPGAAEPIAIVGIAARFAGSPTLDAFWAHLRAGADLVTEIPADRWDWRDYDQATPADRAAPYSRWGSFVDGIDRFDPLFFGISPREAQIIDPQERLFLQAAWHAVEDAGHTRADLRELRAGVYVGAMYGLYQLHEAADGRIGASSHASIANRVSYTLGLTGPSLGVDTMCSSSLTAIHLAVRDLRSGETEVAVAGGVNLHAHPYKYRFLGQGGFTSSDGRCRSFGADGDGYVPGEGVGAVVLRPLSAALRDGDHVHALILGTSVNHGGRTNGFTVPNPVAQGDLVARALAEAGADPATLGYLEAHGTGTALGDPVEIRGLARVLAGSGLAAGALPIGSVKSNIGHAESASGMAGLGKVLLQLRHGELVPSLHADPLNPNIDFESTPLRVQREPAPWPRRDGLPRRAGLSSFGAGGANAHLVIEEFVRAETPRTATGPWVFPVSAQTPERLGVVTSALADAVEGGPGDAVWLADVAHTLVVGREDFPERLAVVASNAAELAARLRAGAGEGVWTGSARGRGKRPAIAAGASPRDAAAAWAAGATLPRAADPDRRRVPLPGYPFEELRCWLTEEFWSPTARTATAPKHPLLGEIDPARSLDGLAFESRFGPEHAYIDGHRVRDTRLLPGAVLLELARAAAERAGVAAPVVLRGVRWLRPLVVTDAERALVLRLTRDGDGVAFTAHDDGGTLLAEGSAATATEPIDSTVDIAGLRARLTRGHDGGRIYADLDAAGLHYGPALRAVEWIAAGDREALVRLRVPAEARKFSTPLHPSLVDGALHALAVLREATGPAMAPFAAAAVDSADALAETGYAHVREVGRDRYDLVLTDDTGRVRARLRDLALRPAPVEGTAVRPPSPPADDPAAPEPDVEGLMFTPHWSPLTSPVTPPTAGTTWLVHGPEAAPLADAVAAALGQDTLRVDPEQVHTLDGRPAPARVLFLTGPATGRTDDQAALETAQRRGVLALFALAKRLQRLAAPVRLTVVTQDAVATAAEPVRNPFAAATHGLALSLGREHLRWTVSVVDAATTDAQAAVAPVVLAAPAGGPFAVRGGALLGRALRPVEQAPVGAAVRDGGVYLLLGGAGGIGLELTAWLVRHHRARVLLVGRGELDQARRHRVSAIDPSGALVSYHRADAADPAALRAVVDTALSRHGALHGVVHATIVLRDQSVAAMTEEGFRAALEAKTRTSVALRAALAGVSPDFVLFFSSAVALSGSAGQANYAAGSAFADAFAQHLDDVLACRVAVVDWGYWGTVGIVADDEHRARLAASGIHSIDPAEGMAVVRRVLGRRDRQVLAIKADADVLAAAGVDLGGTGADTDDRSLVPALAALPPVQDPVSAADQRSLRETLVGWTWTLLSADGLFDIASTEDGLAVRLGVDAKQRRLFGELVRILAADGYLAGNGGVFTAPGRPVPADPRADLAALCARASALAGVDKLLVPCMDGLLGVLRGTTRATDVLFPGGSVRLVEDAYRGSPVVDRANELVVGALPESAGSGSLTVLEVGAGTGGTTASLLPALAASGARVTYVYTDISPAFLRHGKERFGAEFPFVRFEKLDVSTDPLAQGFTAGSVDVVVAANVLHATHDLLATLGAVGTLLRPGGRLILNEATANTVTTTLTFGLLDGWWLARDPHLRLPGTPLLSAAGWRHALGLAGFARVRAISADVSGAQHVVVAETPTAAVAPVAGPAAVPAAGPPPVVTTPVGAGGDDLVEVARDLVRDAFVAVLDIPRDRLWLDETYEGFGVDSLTVPRVADLLGESVGELPATLLFEQPTIRDLADFLVETRAEQLRALRPAAPAAPHAPEVTAAPVVVERSTGADTRVVDTRVAVIGMAGRYPLAEDVEQFWANLRAGRDCVREVPADRWDWRAEGSVDGRPVSRWGGFLDGIAEFDPKFFRMTLTEARVTDPQERLFLQTAWHTIEDAAYPVARLRGQRVGVYVGVMYGHYQLMEGADGLAGGMGYASIANRVSYALDLRGPSMAVDTMCSSSLTSVHLACEALLAGAADLALAGGVNLTPHPRKHRQLAAGGFTGTDGRCRSFGDGGDGMVPGEGVGAVLLKPLAAAERDGDRVLGVILGSAVNHGGKTGGYAVPSPTAQREVITAALARSGVDPASLSYVEAHGTGTALGDPTEVAGLTSALGQRADAVAIGSVKSSVGHLESAAGIAALTKVLLQLRERKLVPSLHADRLNPAVDWASAPVRVQRELSPWTADTPLRAGISAFGAGGSNAHLVVEQAPEPASATTSGPWVFPLSARDPEALVRVVVALRDHLRAAGADGVDAMPALAEAAGVPPTAGDASLDELGVDPTALLRLRTRLVELGGDDRDVHGGESLRTLAARVPGGARATLDRVAHTLQVGREAMAHRLAFVAHDSGDLTDQLTAVAEGRAAGYAGAVTTEPGPATAPTDTHDTARRWASGQDIDWAAGRAATPRPVSLPGYPFARTRCWIDVAPTAPSAPAPVAGELREAVLGLLAGVTGFPASGLDPTTTFHDHGLDSLGLIRLAGEATDAFGVPVGPDQLLATPTPAALACWLADQRPQPAATAPPPAAASEDDPVVIVGMAGILPGSADVTGFWANLARGGDLISEVPADRWDARAHFGDPAEHADRTRVTRAGFLPGVAEFDPLFFGISPREARWMDPRQRLLLKSVWSALEDAGVDPASLAGSDTGLFVGVGASDYAELVQRSGTGTDAYAATGLTPSMLANRVSFLLDLRGPSEPVDTACSSSLVALHRAAEALRLGHCGLVVAAGVSVLLSPGAFASLERAGMLAPDGVGRAFDADATGYVRGEGVGAVVLTTLSRARAEGLPVLAVLRGTAVNHGGRSNSLTSPNPAAQADVVVKAHRVAGVDPSTIGYLETHGTGTVIGDPVEIRGLREAFGTLYADWGLPMPTAPHCALGALKNTIGHLEPAAGIAALIRVLLSLRHGRITGDPHGPVPNPGLGLDGTPFEVARAARDWPAPAPGVPRRAGISSFGYGGVNAHVVLEEFQQAQPAGDHPVVLVLSARDPERLRALVKSFVDAPGRWAHDLAGTAHTLQVGRAEHAQRLAFAATTGTQALDLLRGYLAGTAAGVHTGTATRADRPGPATGLDDDATAAAWVRGAEVDWSARWTTTPTRRSLPTYPFAPERHWFTDGGPAPAERPEISLFGVDWEPRPVEAPAPAGQVLVFGELAVPGAVRVRAGVDYRIDGPRAEIRPGAAGDYVRLLRDLAGRGTPVARVAHQWPLSLPGRQDTGIESVFLLAKAMMTAGVPVPTRVQVLVPADGSAESWGGFDAALRAALPGTAFSAARVAAGVDERALLAEVTACRVDAAVVRLDHTGRSAQVLRELPGDPVEPGPALDGGVHLVTGGLGGLGVILAEDLLSRGGRVALTGRSEPGARATELDRLRGLGEVEYFRADVTDAAAMTAVVDAVRARWGALTGVFHLAGTASRTPLPHKDVTELREHLRARVTGTAVLDRVTAGEPLAAFVLFGSLAGLLGDYGLVDYAVGARHLDGAAAEREALRVAGERRGRTITIDWPMWRSGGMHVDAEDERRYLATTGFRYLEAEDGLTAMRRVLRLGRTQVAVLPGDPDRMRELVEGTRLREEAAPVAAPAATAALTRARASSDVLTELRGVVGEVLGLDGAALDPDAGFGEYGLDSFGLQSLAAALLDRHGITVATTTLYGANTLSKLADHLTTEFPQAAATVTEPPPVPEAPAPTAAAPRAAPRRDDGEPIAIVGLSGRFPGSADLAGFWADLAEGRDLITETPPARWDWREVARTYGGTARWGGFLDDVDHFDPRFFRISPAEAQVIDPQHRLFLQHAWAALEDAGQRADRLSGRKVAVFAGVQFTDYEAMVLRRGDRDPNPHTGTGLARTMLANRVSYLLDLRGPSETIDTACSSSLLALHRAVRSLRAGETELAIAGGVSLVLSPQTVVAGTRLGVLSPDGRCKTLDAGANGYVKGEGVAVLVLKPLSTALADGDRVHAVIRGSAVNHGGRASSLTAPNPLAQADLLVEAYRDARVPVETVSYVELHGTGTKLGDPVEIEGLARAHRVLATPGVDAVECGVGTVKSNIGHLEPAAGVAGVVKVVLAMRHRVLPPTLHIVEPNPLVDFTGTPFAPVTEAREWAPTAGGRPVPLRAGVSSFGFGGVNAHVVLEEAPRAATAPSSGAEVFLLSARDEDALRRYAESVLAFLEGTTAPLSAIAHTSQVGRVPMAVRLAVVADSVDALRERLTAFTAGRTSAKTAGDGQEWLTEPEGAAYIARLAREGGLKRLARLWEGGAEIDWTALRAVPAAITSIPTYPFAKESHWLDGEQAPATATAATRLLARHWEPAPLPPAALPGGDLLVLADEHSAPLAATAFPTARVLLLDGDDEAAGLRAVARAGTATTVVDLVDAAGPRTDTAGVDWARVVLLRELVAAHRRGPFAYLHLTRGLTTFGAVEPTLRGAVQAGFVAMLPGEYRGTRARTVDVDTLDLAAVRAVVAAELAAGDGESRICVREGLRHVPVLRETTPTGRIGAWTEGLGDGVVVVTGGAGGLGRLLAAELVERGATKLVLLGRSALPDPQTWAARAEDPDATAAERARFTDLAALVTPGVLVRAESVDVADAAAVAAALGRVRAEWGPVIGLVHCAGVGLMTDPAFLGKRVADMRAVLAPKVEGTSALLAACAGDPLRFAVLYSSVSAAVPALAAGMSDYSVANAVLDRVAEHRAAAGGPLVVRALDWPSWRSAGMPEVDTPVYRDLGLRGLDPAVGLDLLDRAMACAEPVVLPCAVDPERFDARALTQVAVPRAAEVTPAAPAPVPTGPTSDAALLPTVTRVIAGVLRLAPERVTPDAGFADLGLDSIMIAQVVAALERALGVPVEPSALLENPTAARLAAALADVVPGTAAGPEPAVAPVARPVAAERARASRDIAIIGIACHFPGAPDHRAFWRNLVAGVDSVTEVPASRWDANRLWSPLAEPGRTVSKWGGFLDDIEDFDPEYFKLDAAAAPHMDPLCRQFLEAGAECLADAGLTPADVAGSRLGVFAGARAANFGAHHGQAGPHSISGMAQNFIAAHLSHFLDVRGPALVLDSACSSALVAVHTAVAGLRTGETDLALAGGVEVLLDEVPFIGMSEAGALSPTGRCHTFDERADGIVLGEGVGMLLLKRLDDALRDGDRVYAVIEGSAVNNDGRTMGITTPNPDAQREVIERALADAGVRASALGYVEAHGTGTMIGDPMELKALTAVLRADTAETGFCGVGSVKTNIGHTLSAAGIAGAIKVALSVWHGQLPPTLHCATLNPRFRFADSPLYPVREATPWTGRGGVRRGGVSSFGFGGTNAHLVLRQAPEGHVLTRAELPAPRYRRRRFWFGEQVPAAAAPEPAAFFELQF
ncbi:SDR family NAD(P)-dependent oxidoreductase [Actinokineospora sp. 24-640]